MRLFEIGNQQLSPQQIEQIKQRVSQLTPSQYAQLVRQLQILKHGDSKQKWGGKLQQTSANNLGWYTPGQQNKK